MQIEVFPTADMVAQVAAARVAAAAREAIALRGSFALAVSGGQTPWQMLRCLAREDVPWQGVHIFQVDERVAPAGHADRNLTHLQDCISSVPLPAENLHAMPVNDDDLES